MFFYVQIMYMLLMNTNEFMIGQLAGNEYVVEYSVYQRIFTLGGMVISLALTPVWSAVTKAIAEGNYNWVRSLYKKTLLLGGIGTVCEFLLIPFLQFGINIWLGDEAITVNYGYALVYACIGSLMILNGVLSSIANGLGKLKSQVIFYTLGVAIKLPLAYVLVKTTGLWIGVMIANIVAMALYCAVQPFILNKVLKRLNGAET
jgi:O-antigen/teichoic acid export membrane protein